MLVLIKFYFYQCINWCSVDCDIFLFEGSRCHVCKVSEIFAEDKNQSNKQTIKTKPVSSSLVIFRDVPPCRLCDWLLLLGRKGWLAVLLPCSYGARKERKYCYQECDAILIGKTHFGGGFVYIFFCHEKSHAICQRDLDEWKGELREDKEIDADE